MSRLLPQVLWAFVPVSNESIAAHEQLVGWGMEEELPACGDDKSIVGG
jgi:hypothetical protein